MKTMLGRTPSAPSSERLRWPADANFLISRAQALAQPAWLLPLLLRLVTVEGRCLATGSVERGHVLERLGSRSSTPIGRRASVPDASPDSACLLTRRALPPTAAAEDESELMCCCGLPASPKIKLHIDWTLQPDHVRRSGRRGIALAHAPVGRLRVTLARHLTKFFVST